MSEQPAAAAASDVAVLDALEPAAFIERMAPLFEGAPRFLARLAGVRPFGTLEALFGQASSIAHAMSEAEQIELIDAHPRLGAQPGSLSALSFLEQGYDRGAAAGPPDVAAELARLNQAYEERFGFRYCVYVAGRPPEALLPAMAAALDAVREDEINRALDAVVDIAAARWPAMAGRAGAT